MGHIQKENFVYYLISIELWLITHYLFFEWVLGFHIIFHHLPWLQNGAKMRKRKNPIFCNQDKQCNVNMMQKHENMCRV